MTSTPHVVPLAAAAIALVLLAGCTSAAPTDDTSVSGPVSGLVPTGDPTALATGLTTPWSVVFVGETALVSSRDTGEILEVVGDETRVVGTVPGVVHVGESGLLGLAVADDELNLFAYSTGTDENRIHRIPLTGEPGSFGLGTAEVILDGIPAASYHDGGRIAFGPDGMLYATTGDAGQRSAAQDPDDLGGKILRMTPDGDVPEDNPFPGSLVFSLGHRNPQGIAWDADGRLFAAEFGQDTWDELNIITPGGNYGWPEVEGIGGDADFIDPVQQWGTDEASPSGITIIEDTLFVANLRGQTLRAVPVSDPGVSTEYLSGDFGRFRDVAEGPDGSLWVLTSNTDTYGTPGEGDDRILRVELTATRRAWSEFSARRCVPRVVLLIAPDALEVAHGADSSVARCPTPGRLLRRPP